jgi:hypothetical protein
MTQVSLNDGVSWFLYPPVIDNSNRVVISAQQTWLGKGVFLADDYNLKKFMLPVVYYEGGTSTPLAAVKAQLFQAGTQNLTFDNLTQTQVRLGSFGEPSMVPGRFFAPWLWMTTLEFLAPTPFAQDIASTTPAGSPFALTGSVAGSTTSFSVTYAGSVRTEPTYTLTVPVGNGVPIVSLVLTNTMAGEGLTIVFPGNLAASTAYSITINTAAFSIVDGSGNNYDFTGSFPRIYGPPTQVNTFTAKLTTASGTSTGVTLGINFFNTWEI